MTEQLRKFPSVIFLLLLLAVCGSSAKAATPAAAPGPEVSGDAFSLLGKYDSVDRAVVRSVDRRAGTVTLCQHELGRYYTLRADNTSMIYDRYRRPISVELLTPGTVVDVTFLRQSKHLNSLVVSDLAWIREGLHTYQIDRAQELLQMDGDRFHLPATALLLSAKGEDWRRIIAEELLPGDVLTVCGVDKEIYSVTVTSGHGYLRLTSTEVGETDIEGAWIRLDSKVIQRVNARMLMTAPEGEYTMRIVGRGANDTRPVTIERGKETVIDASTIELEAPEMTEVTEVTFSVLPEEAEAKLQVDGEDTELGVPVYLAQGVHALRLTAEGYVTRQEYLRVGSKRAAVELTLEEKQAPAAAASTASASASAAGTAVSSASAATSDWWYSSMASAGTGASQPNLGATNNAAAGAAVTAGAGTGMTAAAPAPTTLTLVDVSGNETTRTTMPGFEIRVESPQGVEFYMDGNYMGVTPLSFVKTSGQHTMTLARDGFETRSYSIYVDDAQTSKTYAFPELVQEGEE